MTTLEPFAISLTRVFPVSSTLISIPDWGNVLLDAGEGTWGQLVRQYGLGPGPKADEAAKRTINPDVWQVLRDLRCIFISHMHGDHHIGLATILAKRKLVNFFFAIIVYRSQADALT